MNRDEAAGFELRGGALGRLPRRTGWSRFLGSVFTLLAIAIGWFLVDGTAIEALETVEDRRAAWQAYRSLAERADELDELSGEELQRERAAVSKDFAQLVRVWRAARPASGFEPVWMDETSGRCLTLGSVRVAETVR